MTEWKKEVCGTDRPPELEQVSEDTYIERTNINPVEAAGEGMMEIPAHYECVSRFITVSEYHMLHAMAEAVELKQESDIIDNYTLTLMEEGVI